MPGVSLGLAPTSLECKEMEGIVARKPCVSRVANPRMPAL